MACMGLLAMPPLAANATGYAAGFALSFLLHRQYTFRSNVKLGQGMASYLAVVSGAYAANVITLLGSMEWLGLSPYLAQILGIGVYTVLVFLGSNTLVFDRRNR